MHLTEDQQRLLDESVAELGLGMRTTNCLEENGILYVRDLLQKTPKQLLRINNFGEKTLETIYVALAKQGFYRESPGG